MTFTIGVSIPSDVKACFTRQQREYHRYRLAQVNFLDNESHAHITPTASPSEESSTLSDRPIAK